MNCETIADCTGSLENPCVQPNCTAGICGEQPLEPGTDCLAEEFDTECAVATCSLEGECEFQVVAAGTGCTPDAGGDPSTCNVFACDGEGACVETPVEDGTACSGEGSPCEIRRCLSGSCELDPGICADGYTCTEDHCIASLVSVPSLAEDAPAVAVTACQFTMTVGQWEGEKQTYLGTPLGQDGNLDFTWCNAEFSGERVMIRQAVCPRKAGSSFGSEMAQAGAAQATDFTLVYLVRRYLAGETICGASGNPCSPGRRA